MSMPSDTSSHQHAQRTLDSSAHLPQLPRQRRILLPHGIQLLLQVGRLLLCPQQLRRDACAVATSRLQRAQALRALLLRRCELLAHAAQLRMCCGQLLRRLAQLPVARSQLRGQVCLCCARVTQVARQLLARPARLAGLLRGVAGLALRAGELLLQVVDARSGCLQRLACAGRLLRLGRQLRPQLRHALLQLACAGGLLPSRVQLRLQQRQRQLLLRCRR
jgi:hypothetical protein